MMSYKFIIYHSSLIIKKMSLLKKLAGETAIYGMSSILPRLLNFVLLTPFLTRVLSKSDYGIFNDLYSYVALFNILLTFRLETAYFRYAQKKEDVERAFSTSALFLLLGSVDDLLIIFFFFQGHFVHSRSVYFGSQYQ